MLVRWSERLLAYRHYFQRQGLARRMMIELGQRSCEADCVKGRGEQLVSRGEVGAMAHVQLVQARLPRRRGVRARVGVLEDVRGPAGEALDSEPCDEPAWERAIYRNGF